MLQALVRGFFQKKILVSSVGGSGVDSLDKKFPDGVIMGTRGNVGLIVREDQTPLNKWFVESYKKKYNAYPLGPSYQYARAVLLYKIGMDSAAKKAGKFPTQDQVMAAMKGISFQSFADTIEMKRGGGHQAVHSIAYGVTKYNKAKGEPGIEKVIKYSASCVYPPCLLYTSDAADE